MGYERTVTMLLVLALLATVMGCDADDAKEEGPSKMPPAESMQMDLSPFTSPDKADDLGKADALPKSNFNNAALRVGFLNLSIALHLAVPAAVFAVALSETPTYEAGTWTWDFTTTSAGQTYAANLKGFFDSGDRDGVWLNLEMRVTCTNCLVPTEDFLWYTGRFNVDSSEGTWEFYNAEIPLDDKLALTVDYQWTDETHGSIEAVNVRKDGHENAGDIIKYALDGTTVGIEVHDESAGLDYTAEADTDSGAGWLQVPDYNGGDKACWDEDQLNVDCP